MTILQAHYFVFCNFEGGTQCTQDSRASQEVREAEKSEGGKEG